MKSMHNPYLLTPRFNFFVMPNVDTPETEKCISDQVIILHAFYKEGVTNKINKTDSLPKLIYKLLEEIQSYKHCHNKIQNMM